MRAFPKASGQNLTDRVFLQWTGWLICSRTSPPSLTSFSFTRLVIAVGALLGRIRLFGVSLGVTFVLFAAIPPGTSASP